MQAFVHETPSVEALTKKHLFKICILAQELQENIEEIFIRYYTHYYFLQIF